MTEAEFIRSESKAYSNPLLLLHYIAQFCDMEGVAKLKAAFDYLQHNG